MAKKEIFNILKEKKFDGVSWDIEVDDGIFAAVVAHGKAVANDQHYFEIGFTDILLAHLENDDKIKEKLESD